MKCDEAAERITALLDGELSPEERRDLESHLASCPACREAREAEEAVVARLRALPRPPLPAGFAADVMGKVRAGEAPGDARPAGRILPMWPAWAAAGAVAAAILAMVMVGPGRGKVARDVASAGPPAAKAAPPPSNLVPLMEAAPGEQAAGENAQTRTADTLDKEGTVAALAERQPEADRTAAPAKPAPVMAPAPAPAAAKMPADSKDLPAGRTGEEAKSRSKSAGEATAAAAASAQPGEPAGPSGGAGAVPGPTPVATPVSEPVADRADEGKGDRVAAGGKAKDSVFRKTVEPPLPRVPLFFRVDGVREGQDSVERTLFAQKDLAIARNPWRPAAELPTTYYGRLRRAIEKEVAVQQRSDFPLPEDRVLEIRMRNEDVPRLQALLVKSGTLRTGPDLQIQGSGEVVPAEIVTVAQRLQAVVDNSGLVAGDSGGGAALDAPKADKSAPAKQQEEKPEDGVGRMGGREPGQPRDPPALSAEALRELEKAPRPPSPSGQAAAAAGGSAEVWVEVHLLVIPPVPRSPK
jgi:hypothetical protein